jgi:ADP-ribose pyrophosphatase YjhB (NUDIX family)
LSVNQSVRAAGPTGYLKELRDLIGHRLLLAPGCAVVPFERGRILLHRRTDSGEWDVIGGFMEIGETFEDTARREVREELGLEISWLRLIGVYGGTDFTCRYPNGDLTQMAGALFVARVHGDLVLEPSEVLEVRYFALDRLPSGLRRTAWLLLDRHQVQIQEAAGEWRS